MAVWPNPVREKPARPPLGPAAALGADLGRQADAKTRLYAPEGSKT